KINVVILDFDDEKKRIALGLKQLQSHPWDALSAEMNAGDKVKGKVMVITDYGAFVEVAPGVEGLLHVSEMSWSQHLRSPKDFLKEGQEIDCVILNIDREERKMSLGMKQLSQDPWMDIEFKYPMRSKHTAKVRNFTHFGASSPSWRRAWTASSTSATSAGPSASSTPASSATWVMSWKWWCWKWTRRTAA
nr:S1 RNA-binding domain-containing protein [Flavobacteriales bacterium]